MPEHPDLDRLAREISEPRAEPEPPRPYVPTWRVALSYLIGGVVFGALDGLLQDETVDRAVIVGALFALLMFAFDVGRRWWRRP